MADLRTEIKQSKAFATLEQEAHLSIERTAAVLGHAFADALKPYGITGTQYNVLRILRGAGEAGLCRNDVRDRLVAKVPDATRLIDRLVDARLVTRSRESDDRRVVTTRITPQGLSLLAKLDDVVADVHRGLLGHLTREQLRTLIELLAIARER